MVSSSSKSGTLNPVLNGLYLLMHQLNTKFLPHLVFGSDLIGASKDSRPFIAGLSVPPKHHSAIAQCSALWLNVEIS